MKVYIGLHLISFTIMNKTEHSQNSHVARWQQVVFIV